MNDNPFQRADMRPDGTLPKRRHNCNIDGAGRRGFWLTCTACDGRIHKAGCTARRDKRRDCCAERHEMLGLPVSLAQGGPS